MTTLMVALLQDALGAAIPDLAATLLQRRILVGERDDACNQILSVFGAEDGNSMSVSRIEMQFFRGQCVLEYLPGIISITIIYAVNEQLRDGDCSKLVIGQPKKIFWRKCDYTCYLHLRCSDEADICAHTGTQQDYLLRSPAMYKGDSGKHIPIRLTRIELSL